MFRSRRCPTSFVFPFVPPEALPPSGKLLWRPVHNHDPDTPSPLPWVSAPWPSSFSFCPHILVEHIPQ